MAKYDGEIRAVGQAATLDLARPAADSPPLAERHDALALYLAGDEGWSGARDALGGAFARALPGNRVKESFGDVNGAATSTLQAFARPLV